MSKDKTIEIPIEDAEEEQAEAVEVKTEAAEEAEGSGPGAEAEPEAEASGDANGEEPAKEEATKEEAAKEAESERYMRLMAEFQNYKRRVAKEKSDIHAYANEKIMVGLLEVLDNFERALASEHSADEDSYAKGMELIFTQMKTVLTDSGLAEIEALGEDFDPAKHHAVMAENTDEYESGKVSKVFQKGYTLNNKVIRPAMVAVAN